jgi:two-component system cell cycle sensor histidine kinase/response regulator CckA
MGFRPASYSEGVSVATRRRRRKATPIVLVVEQEPNVRVLAESIIDHDLNCRTLSAASAREAIALLETFADVVVLFTDIQLPDGPDMPDGFALAQHAREIRPDLHVIYTSGRDQTDGMTALAVEGAGFLPKPYTHEQLIEALRRCGLETTAQIIRRQIGARSVRFNRA